MKRICLTLTLLTIGACGSSTPMMKPACDPQTEECDYSHDYGMQTVTSGAEVLNLCQSWTLNNDTELWVNTVELDNGGAYHHSNWFFVPDNNFVLPDGTWDCNAQHFDELDAAILGGVLFAQSTQSMHEIQQFPTGAVVRIPPHSRVIGETHLLNTTDNDLTTDLAMKISTLPPSEVTVKLAPFRLAYHDLHIPAMSQAEFTSSCDIKTTFENTMKKPFALKMYYALPHFHTLATKFELQIFGGPSDGSVVFQDNGWSTQGFGKSFDTPIDLGAANGFTFTCGYANSKSTDVSWGNGGGEMCVMLGFAETIMSFDAEVVDGAGMVTGMDGASTVASGPCSVLGIPFSQDK
jgi:hypothetical protein